MCHQQFALNNIFSETTRPRALIYDLKHCLVDLYQVCSVGGPRVLKGNRPIKSTIEFLLKLHTVMECYMLSEKVK